MSKKKRIAISKMTPQQKVGYLFKCVREYRDHPGWLGPDSHWKVPQHQEKWVKEGKKALNSLIGDQLFTADMVATLFQGQV